MRRPKIKKMETLPVFAETISGMAPWNRSIEANAEQNSHENIPTYRR